MNPEEIKKGELHEHDFAALSPANGIKNTEPAPKYDPCRPFKAGDIVKPCSVKGRWWDFTWKERHEHIVVTEDEDKDGVMGIKEEDSIYPRLAPAVFFQLVTPVEEREPYSVHEADTIKGFDIMRDGLCVMTFPFGSKEAGYYHSKIAAKEAAQAERDRLNAEYRKEQEQ